MSADLEVQKAIRNRLAGTASVTALVPAAHIIDRHARPEVDPAIILGDSQAVDEGDSIARDRLRVYHTLHIWKREGNFTGAKQIAGAIAEAIQGDRLALGGGWYAADSRVSSMRFLRDPDGVTSHGVVVVEALAVKVPT